MRFDPRRGSLHLLVGLLAALVTVAATAPATLADRALQMATDGRLRLAEAEGSVWHGSARLVLTDVSADASKAGPAPGVAIPGRIGWRLHMLPLVIGQLEAQIRFDGMPRPVSVHGAYDEIRIGEGALGLPSVELGRLGSPWNTVRPSGALHLAWENIVIRNGAVEGRARVELRNASSAMTPVRPLGSYRVEVVGRGKQADLSLATISGPLHLQGSGTFDTQGGLRFVAEASTDAAERNRLQSFLGLLGRREGARTIIRIGA